MVPTDTRARVHRTPPLPVREADPAQAIPTRSTHPAHTRAAEHQTPSSCVGKSHEGQEGRGALKHAMLQECLHPRFLISKLHAPFQQEGRLAGSSSDVIFQL